MPQGFPDPYSAFSEGFRGSFFPTMQAITQAEREKREADERKQEAQRKKEAADNKTVMDAVHLYQQGMTDLAVKMAESTGKFAKGEAAAGFKQLNQLPEEWKKAIGEMSADDPVTAAVFGRYMKMDPKVSGPFVLQILKNWQEQKGKTDTKKFLEDEIRRAGGGGAAAGPAPVATGTALAQSGAQVAPSPEFQGTEAGGRGSTALAQRLLEARSATAPSAAPAAPAIPGAPAATPPATDLSTLNSAALRRIQAKLVQRGKKEDVALADKIGVLAKSAEDREGKSEKAPTTRQVVRGNETITEEWNPQTKKFEAIARGPRFQEREAKTPEVVILQNMRDKLPKDDPRRAELDRIINKKGETTSRFMGYDDQGRPIFAEGTAAVTVAEKGRMQQERRLGETLSFELAELKKKLSKSDIGVRGFVNEMNNLLTAQLIPALNDPKVTKNRSMLRSIREKGMRLMTTDNRFNVQDRKAIETLFPADGIFESYESAQDKLTMLAQIISDRTTFVSGQLKDRKPIQDMTPQELGEAYQKGMIDNKTALRALRLFHGM